MEKQQINKEVVEAVTIERLIEDGKIVSATYSRYSKINLGGYESTDIGWSYTLEYPKVEHDKEMPVILNTLVAKAEDKIRHERSEKLKQQRQQATK